MRFLCAAVLLLLGAATVPAQSPASPRLSELREEARVRRIQWPVTLDPRVPGGCDEVTREDIVVREDGVEVPVDGFENRRLPAIHAVVLDNSGSMDARLDAAKKAALAYLERLPPDEPAMLATFSDNLVLHTPLTTDREALIREMAQIEPRAYTALNDALHYTVGYLAGRSERKVLVLITDGCDSVSLTRHSLDGAARRAAEVPDLTVFPIGIDLPARCDPLLTIPGSAGGPVVPLQKLATRSGGRLYRSKEALGLGMIFDEILERLRSEGFVTYRPLAHGDGPRDRAGLERPRKVRIESRRPEVCRVSSAGPWVRTEPAVQPSTAPRRPQVAEHAIDYREGWSIDGDAAPVRRLELRERSMHGHGADLDRERSVLYSATAYYLGNRYVAEVDRKVRRTERDFKVDVPPFDWLRRSMTNPESMLLYLMQGEAAPFVPLSAPAGRREQARRVLGELWVHGQTMLEMRDALGRGLFTYPGYREFAYRRTRDAYREEMRRVLEHSTEARALSAADRAQLEGLIDGQRPEPTRGQLRQYLADWLGDIPAHDLVVGFEGWAVNAVLDPGVPETTAASLLDLIDMKWEHLADWFPPPTQVRIVSPLVPAYDAERDLVGFWRILLPQVAAVGAPPDAVPERPLGLTFLRRLAAVTGGRDAWPRGVRMRDLSYRWDNRRERRRIVRAARKRELVPPDVHWREIPVVRMTLGIDGGDALPCTVLWDPRPRPEAPAPAVCVDLGDPSTRPVGAWAEELRDGILDLVPECRLELEG